MPGFLIKGGLLKFQVPAVIAIVIRYLKIHYDLFLEEMGGVQVIGQLQDKHSVR